MTSITFFFFFIPILAFVLLMVNLIFAPHNPYQEKNSAFECGFTSFVGQNRTQFSISFFIFALLFLLFDLEILLVYPYLVSSYTNETYGLFILLIFLGALTLGFAFELGKKALFIDSRQTYKKDIQNMSVINKVSSNLLSTRFIGKHNNFSKNPLNYYTIYKSSFYTGFIKHGLKVTFTYVSEKIKEKIKNYVVANMISYLLKDKTLTSLVYVFTFIILSNAFIYYDFSYIRLVNEAPKILLSYIYLIVIIIIKDLIYGLLHLVPTSYLRDKPLMFIKST